ncbi:hypothetical protein EJ03DRAFT_268607 [Teratosphaeria nubilosa]|uniref:Carboxymuconolactone decarboxylase-like domain-containing protein n=1 Tax=Teratosphaeria nubilosa TaxID=161662 RepID=A0A6G1LFL4_9PEZI|nr:hypothetical protein EJ03DRAFT_268607 [Teratosphaeria nubilosa]
MASVNQAFFDKLTSVYHGQNPDWPWYVYAALVFQINDKMDLVGETWKAAHDRAQDQDKQFTVARKLREGLLKASVLVGFPLGINALTTLRQHIKKVAPHLEERLDQDKSLRSSLQRAEKDKRGKEFFTAVYAQHTDKVLHNMSVASGGDLSEFAINAVYGDLMAETSRLDMKETTLLEFLACYASAGSVGLQAKSHMYGSHNVGNKKAEIMAAVEICRLVEAQLGMVKERSEKEYQWLAMADRW